MNRILETVAAGAFQIWQTGIIQAALTHMMQWAYRFLRFYFLNARQTVPFTLGAIVGWWFAKLFHNATTQSMFDALGLPIIIYYLVIIIFCGLAAAGALHPPESGNRR